MDRQKEFVLRTLEERDIRFVRLWFTDVLGYLKSVAIAPAELEGAFEEGIGFDGSSIEGFARVSNPTPSRIPTRRPSRCCPGRTSSGHHHSARMFCDITMPDGSPSWADPRHVLRRHWRSQRPRLLLLRASRDRVLPAQARVDRRSAAHPGRTTPATSTRPCMTPHPTSAGTRSTPWNSWASRWSSATTKAPPASRRSTCASPTRCRWPTT